MFILIKALVPVPLHFVSQTFPDTPQLTACAITVLTGSFLCRPSASLSRALFRCVLENGCVHLCCFFWNWPLDLLCSSRSPAPFHSWRSSLQQLLDGPACVVLVSLHLQAPTYGSTAPLTLGSVNDVRDEPMLQRFCIILNVTIPTLHHHPGSVQTSGSR